MMTKQPRTWTMAAGLALLAGVGSPASRAEEPKDTQIEITVGGQATDVDGERNARFERYRDEPNGVLLESVAVRYQPEEDPWLATLSGHDLGQDDEFAELRLERPGRLRVDLGWDRTPHLTSRGSTLLHTRSGGSLLFAEPVRALLEANPALLPQVLAGQGREVEVGTRRDRGSAAIALRLARGWDLQLFGLDESQSGTKRISTGTYIRRQQVGAGTQTGAGFFDRERIEIRGIELPAAIDTSSREVGLGTSFRRDRFFFDFGWEQSSFENDLGTLVWDNPFEATPGATSSSLGLAPQFEQEPSGALANQGNRGRFARAALDLAPDNDYQRIHATGSVMLPAHTRVYGSFSLAKMEQDDPFLSYTLNPAILFSLGADGVAGTPDDVRAQDVALPRSSLDGEVRTTRTDLRVTSRPIESLDLRASFRRYEYDDRRPEILFPGFAAAGDSYFRAGIGQRDASGTRVLFNEIGGYTKSAIGLGGGWRFGQTVGVDLDFTRTDWQYEDRQVEETTEDSYRLGVRVTPHERFAARFSWLEARRDFEGPYHVGFETSRLRAFDVWERDRSQIGLEIEIFPADAWTLTASYDLANDEYRGVVATPTPAPTTGNVFPSFPYGLNETESEALAVAATYAPEGWTLTASAGLENGLWDSLAVPKTSRGSDAIQFDPKNRWRRTQDDELLWASLSLAADLTDRLDLEVDLGYSDYQGEQKTVNPDTPDINSGVAYDFPELAEKLWNAELTLTWQVQERLALAARYLYEPYRLDDFAWDQLQPAMQGVFLETGASPTDLRTMNASRYLLLDSRYSDYTANVFTLLLTYAW